MILLRAALVLQSRLHVVQFVEFLTAWKGLLMSPSAMHEHALMPADGGTPSINDRSQISAFAHNPRRRNVDTQTTEEMALQCGSEISRQQQRNMQDKDSLSLPLFLSTLSLKRLYVERTDLLLESQCPHFVSSQCITHASMSLANKNSNGKVKKISGGEHNSSQLMMNVINSKHRSKSELHAREKAHARTYHRPSSRHPAASGNAACAHRLAFGQRKSLVPGRRQSLKRTLPASTKALAQVAAAALVGCCCRLGHLASPACVACRQDDGGISSDASHRRRRLQIYQAPARTQILHRRRPVHHHPQDLRQGPCRAGRRMLSCRHL